jgi:hypothetical protein
MVRCVIVWPKAVPVDSLLAYHEVVVGRVIECEDIGTQVHLIFECDEEEYKIFREVVELAGAQRYERFLTICEPLGRR